MDARQQTVLRKCKVKEKNAWGKGLHIFIPVSEKGYLLVPEICVLPLITNTPIQVHCPKHLHQCNKVWVNEKTVEGCPNWIISPQLGVIDDVVDIYKLFSYFVCQTSGWKDSFFQTNYILHEVLGKDGSHRKKDVCSILNLISEAHLIN